MSEPFNQEEDPLDCDALGPADDRCIDCGRGVVVGLEDWTCEACGNCLCGRCASAGEDDFGSVVCGECGERE